MKLLLLPLNYLYLRIFLGIKQSDSKVQNALLQYNSYCKGHFLFAEERSYGRFMNESNTHYSERKRGKRKEQAYKIIIPVLFIAILIIAILIAILYFLFSGGNSKDNVVINHTNSQPNITIDDNVTEENDDFQSSTTNPDWNLTLVNKWNPLPDNYAITLVEVPGGEKVDERIYEPLMEMLEAAKEENWDQLPKVVSGYRTQETQQKLYDDKIAEYKQQGYSENEAVEQAEQWVAVPGYSEHQLGIAVDINGATYDLYFWLQENSYKYGFIFRYPAGKTDITGTAEEVWHYRYVGVEAATEMYEQGLCLEEYLDKIEKKTEYIEPNSGYARTAFHTGKAEREIPRCKTGLAACGRRHIGGTKRLYCHSPSVKSVAGIG